MNVWVNQQISTWRDVLGRLRAQPVAALLNSLVIGIALSLPTVLYVILDNVQAATRQVSREPQLSLFMSVDATAEEIAKVRDDLKSLPDVGEVRHVPRERALEELKSSSSLGDILGQLDHNPLPDAFVATARDRNPKTLERIRDAVSKWNKVEHVQVDAEWARRLYAALRVGQALVVVLGALLGTAVVAVTFNTIRLQILTRQEEIEVTRLIGATYGYIRRPFLYAGAVQGIVGAAVACLLVFLISRWLNHHLSDLSVLYNGEFQLKGLSGWDTALILMFSGLLGWVGAWLSVSRHLWRLDF